jgi:uncharacterized protein
MAEETHPVADTPGQPSAEPVTNPLASTPPDPTSPADPSLVEPPPGDTSPADTPPGAPPGPEIEPWLREILRCPNCGSTLSDGSGPSGPELHCTNAECRLAYRIDEGIPVLLVDESRSLAD